MEVIPNSYIARVVLAYLYEEKLNQAAIEFCKTSPYLREERDFVKRGFRPATCISLKLTALFREYCEIQQKVDHFVERRGPELDIQQDQPLVKKVDLLLALLKQAGISKQVVAVAAKKEPRKSVAGCKRKRGAPSPHPSLSSSTPEVGEPKQKRICGSNPPACIVLSESAGRNLSNLSHISPIGDRDESTQESSCREDEAEDEEQEKGEDGEDELEVSRSCPALNLFKLTMLENDDYQEKLADLINKGRQETETSMITQGLPDPKEGPSSAKDEQASKESEAPQDQDSQSININFDELISNIVNSAVKDPVFDDIMGDISTKAVLTQSMIEEDGTTTTPPPETPLKDRLRKTCRKNYNPSSSKRSCKKVKIISDVPYYGGIPEGVDVENSQPAAAAVVKIEPAATSSSNLNIPPATTIIQPEVTSTEDQPVAMTSTTQYYVIQPDNTAKLVDINQLQFPTQQTSCLTDQFGTTSQANTLIPISGAGIPEHTYYFNVPNCYLESNSQLPVYINTYPGPILEPSVSNPAISMLPEPSPDKFLIFPSSTSASSAISTMSNTVAASSIVSSTSTATVSAAAINSICSTFVPLAPKPEVKSSPPIAVPLIAKPEVKNTPQNSTILNTKARSNSTPSRKASHIRILNFHTPAKQSPLAAGTSARIATPGSAPPSVDSRPSRIHALAERMKPILETSIKQEAVQTPDGATSGPTAQALNPNSVSNTPRVAKDPRTCVRVLSRSTSEEEVIIVDPPMVEIPPAAVAEVQNKKTPAPPRVKISEAEMEEWRRIRAISKSNFDQHLRLVEEQRSHTTTRTPYSKRKKPPKKKKSARKVPPGSAEPEEPAPTPVNADESVESQDIADTSITDLHGQMLADALASTKKPEVEKPPAKTPIKGKTPIKEAGGEEEEEEQKSKIYVKIATPRKKTPVKASPKRRVSKGDKSSKKRRTSSPRKKVATEQKKKEEVEEVQPEVQEEKEKVVEVVEDTAVEMKQVVVEVKESKPVKEVAPEPEPEPETPVKVDESSLSQVEETPPVVPKPVKDHPKLLAKKSSAEYVRKEQEESAAAANTASGNLETPPEKPPSSVTVDCSFGTSLFLETPFKSDWGSIPITPRFLMPNQIENTPLVKVIRDGTEATSSIKKSGDINTPIFPITPGLISTPKSINSVSPHSLGGTGGFSSRRTDYSSGSSYYKPDESDDLDKNLEAMLHGKRKKRQSEVSEPSLEKHPVEEPAPEPEVPPQLEPTPQKEEEPQVVTNVSSSGSSCSCSSSSDGSSSDESSPENTPIKLPKVASPAPNPAKPSSSLFINALEARRQQQAELEAKKQRTIARMKNAKLLPPKKIERKFVAPPGFKARKVVIARKESLVKVIPAPPTPTTRLAPSASSKRKNPTPRKVVLVDLPVSLKKHSPKRKAQQSQSQEGNRKSPRSSLPISEQDVPRILTPRKDQAIEGTYEYEDLTNLRCTPDIPDIPDPDKKPVYACQSPERGVEPDNCKGTPDSNKENLSLEEPRGPVSNPEMVSESSEGEEEEDPFNECSLVSRYEGGLCKSFVRMVYNDEGKSDASGERSEEIPRPIRKLNIVLEGRKVCIQAQDPIMLFEQPPKKPGSAPKKEASHKSGTSKKSKSSSTKSVDPVPVPTVTTPTLKAKINVVQGVRKESHSANKWREARLLAERQRLHQKLLASKSKKEKPDPPPTVDKVKKKPLPVTTTPSSSTISESSITVGKELPPSPSPKMPLKLDMKHKKNQEEQQRRASVTEPEPAGNTESPSPPVEEPPAPPPPPPPPKEKVGSEFEIDMILTQIHG